MVAINSGGKSNSSATNSNSNFPTSQRSYTPVNPSLLQWEDAPTELIRHCAMCEFYGDTGTGRTTLALGAPGPIALIHFAEKLEGIVQPYARQGKVIKMLNVGGVFIGNDDEIKQQARATLDRLKDAWFDAYSWAKTIIIDTHTELWQLVRIAYFAGLKPTAGRVDRNYDAPNSEVMSLINSFKAQSNTNVILIGQTADEWTKPKAGQGERTGKRVRATHFKDVPFKSDVIVRTSIVEHRDPINPSLKKYIYRGLVEKSWHNPALLGVELDNEMRNYPLIMSLITGLDAKIWGG